MRPSGAANWIDATHCGGKNASVVAKKLVPEDRAREYNFALLDFGSTVCASEPNCESCFANEFCQYYRDEDTSEMF
jgi:adenine-specific DNA glycosylase